jgi:hypothetical protein
MTTALDRRTFLKQAGTGTVVLAGASVLAGMGAAPAIADDEENGTGFFFSGLDTAGSPADSFLMWGCGHIDENKGHITGNGEFVHYDGTAPKPQPIKATGLWEPRHLVSFNTIGHFGTNNAGIMVADVVLFRQAPEPGRVIPGTLTVVCNIPQVPLFTGEEEGFQLLVEGLSFKPVNPTVGISGFSRSLADSPERR